jgi:hypothetical protein
VFNCSVCSAAVGPRVKPVRTVTGIRRVEYHNTFTVEDEWGNEEQKEVDSAGTEITGEALVCAQCAGEKESVQPSLTVTGARSFSEKLPDPLRVPFISCAIQSALEGLGDGASRRKRRAAESAVPLLKHFTDTNKNFAI